MRKLQTKWASIVLIMTLMISLMPAMTASAASTLVIKNLYTDTTNAGTSTARPTDSNLVTRVTQLPFTLNVETTNVTDSQIPSIYFEITNMNSGAVVTEKNNKAQINGSNLVKFDNIQLTEGLNKVVVYLGESNAIASAPGWLYYAPTTNLSDITVNNAQLEDGKIYPIDRGPLKAGTTGVQIKTKASNASAVQATLTGDSLPKQGFKSNDGYFYFTGDDKNKSSSTCASVTSFCLNPGDNIISFTASNDTNKYQAVKKLWYDNGQPFAFNGKIFDTNDTTTTKDLITVPTFQSSALTFKTSIKSDYDSSGTSLRYRYVDVAVNDASIGIIDLGGDDIEAINPVVTVTGATYSAVTSTSLTRNKEYLVKDTIIEIPSITDVAKNEQRLTFTFRDVTNSLIPVITEYKFKYIDPDHPYIDKSTLSNGTIENNLSLSDSNLVNELPADIHVYANAKTVAIKAMIDGVYYPDNNYITGTLDATTQLYKYDLKLQGITDGNKKLSIELYEQKPGVTGYSVYGTTTDYNLSISNAPYVLINNISNSMTIKNIKNLTCGTTEACISGRLVNFYQDPVTSPAVPVNKIEVSMNESVTTLDSRTLDTIFDPVTNSFVLPLSTFNTDLTKVMVEGRNTLKFKIYVNNVFITEQSYDIYLFSTDAPQFTSIKPVENGTSGIQFVANSNPDTYTTTQRSVSFNGLYSSLDANGAASPIKALTLIVHTKDAKGDALVYQQTIGSSNSIAVIDQTANSQSATTLGTNYFSSITSTNFTTNAFKLLDNSDMVFEFRITNNSNITATKSITITRQNVPYTVVQPLLIKNTKGELQSNINSDFYNIIIEAENADSVVFNKDQATKRTVASVDQYLYTVTGLKPGANQIKFTINRNGAKVNGSFILYNTNTNIQGAATLQGMNSSYKLFNGGLKLSFPKDTKLMRNVADSNNNQYISVDRKILFGIADTNDGRVDKTLYPVPNGYYKSKISVKVPEDTFHAASNLYYMDAGFIPAPNSTTTTPDDLTNGLNGTGVDPYDTTNSGRAYFNRLNDEIVVPTQEGSLTLQFDPAIREDAGKYITVFFYDIFANYANTTDYGWKNIGGVVDMKSNAITVPFRKFGYYQVMYMDRSFDDMTGHSFARNELETLYSKGLMKAKTTFSFGPNDYITRGEFAQILVKIFKLPLNYAGNSTFSDVLKIDNAIGMLYDYKYVETAARAGIIRGQASNRFNPGGSITRQDAAVMIARAAEMKMSTDLNKSLLALQKTFTDGDRIESYSRPAVEAVFKAGLIEGIPNTLLAGQKKETVRFDPTELLTRAQASIIGYRVMKQQKMVP